MDILSTVIFLLVMVAAVALRIWAGYAYVKFCDQQPEAHAKLLKEARYRCY